MPSVTIFISTVKSFYLATDDLEIPINQQIDKEPHYISLLH